MPAQSRNPAYIAGKADFEAGKPRNTDRWDTLPMKQRYLDGYHKADIRAQKAIDKFKPKEHPNNPVARCVATGRLRREKAMGSYDYANDEFFSTAGLMDAYHGL